MSKAALMAFFSFLMVSGSAFAFNIEGKYIFKEAGCSGNMEIKENTFGMDPHIIAKISTVCTNQYNECQLTAKGVRITSSDNSISSNFVSIDKIEEYDDSSPAKFDIEFTKYGASLHVQKQGPFCGLNAYYSGKWIKEWVNNRYKKTKAK